ncbi:MAG: GNAT family N-acetyltransferase [Planctomycetes bacterium]|nr:GNAT family N-acetyltransferase [Planctomycetota bacterium]
MPRTALPRLQTRIISDFDDPAVAPHIWRRLLVRGHTNTVNLTWEWQRNWWMTFGRGKLMLILVERQGEPQCIAPLFADNGMVFNICPEDQLDIVGHVRTPDVLEAIIETACECVPAFQGIRLYFIPDISPTGAYLEQAAERLGLDFVQEAILAAPQIDIDTCRDAAIACTRKKSLLRHENYFRREGRLEVQHARTADRILPQLDAFFEQHIARRAATPQPSLFLDRRQRDYYRSIVANIGPTGWLRFTRIDWNERAIAFHFGLSYRRRFLFGVPSFDIELRDRSPGEVLLRQLILAALDEGATIFDFGPGEEAYKYRFATREVRLVTWGLYPKSP